MSGTTRPNLTKFMYILLMVLLWRCCDILSTSDFVDDVKFSYNGPYGNETLPQQNRCHIVRGLAPLLHGIGCVLSWMTAGAKTRRRDVQWVSEARRSTQCTSFLVYHLFAGRVAVLFHRCSRAFAAARRRSVERRRQARRCRRVARHLRVVVVVVGAARPPETRPRGNAETGSTAVEDFRRRESRDFAVVALGGRRRRHDAVDTMSLLVDRTSFDRTRRPSTIQLAIIFL